MQNFCHFSSCHSKQPTCCIGLHGGFLYTILKSTHDDIVVSTPLNSISASPMLCWSNNQFQKIRNCCGIWYCSSLLIMNVKCKHRWGICFLQDPGQTSPSTMINTDQPEPWDAVEFKRQKFKSPIKRALLAPTGVEKTVTDNSRCDSYPLFTSSWRVSEVAFIYVRHAAACNWRCLLHIFPTTMMLKCPFLESVGTACE